LIASPDYLGKIQVAIGGLSGPFAVLMAEQKLGIATEVLTRIAELHASSA
jgi:hypothetical protein